jgi:NAD(P)-dependent dehydrogenase (short-subunit alcohol dehydrogenase family)
MAGRLEGQVALITGSTSGIGRATAVLFAQEGARIVVNGRRRDLGEQVAAEIRSEGGDATYFPADIGRSAELRALVQFVLDTYGRIDILVNNAWSGKVGTVLEVEEDEWDRLFAVTLKATYLASKYALPDMLKRGKGVIVNLASVHGVLAAAGWAPYDAAKAGIINLTRQMAVDFGHQGIRVNAICPGWILLEGGEDRLHQHPDLARSVATQYPIGRPGRMVEVARAALFLASDESSFITGHALMVDGGLTIQLQDSLAHRVEDRLRKDLGENDG